MTKARTTAQKRRDKKAGQAKADLPELAPSDKREKNGCFRDRKRQQGKREPDPRLTVLSARARHLGKPDTDEVRQTLTSQMHGDPAGVAILIGGRNPQEAQNLWDVFCGLDRADATYHARILGRGRHAKCGKVEYMPERFEARMDEQSDARSDEERDRAAVNRWMFWHGLVGHLVSHEQTAIWDGVYLRCDLQRQGVLTTAGRAFVAALRVLASIKDARPARRAEQVTYYMY